MKSLKEVEEMYYYRQMSFTVIYVDAYGDKRKTFIRADNDLDAQEKADGLMYRYDWAKIIDIWRS